MEPMLRCDQTAEKTWGSITRSLPAVRHQRQPETLVPPLLLSTPGLLLKLSQALQPMNAGMARQEAAVHLDLIAHGGRPSQTLWRLVTHAEETMSYNQLWDRSSKSEG